MFADQSKRSTGQTFIYLLLGLAGGSCCFHEDVRHSVSGLGGDFWSDDDSDFDLDSCSDSDFSDYEEDDGLCNTMLLVGPHGVGKTSTVSAVATELGYKVSPH